MAQKAKAPESPGDEAPCKLQKCGFGEFTTKDSAKEEAVQTAETNTSEENAVSHTVQAAGEIPNARLVAEVQSLLVGVDLQSMTMGGLRTRLEGRLGLAAGSLTARKRIRRQLSFVVHQEVLKKSQRSQHCEQVVQELLKLEGYPLSARQMLIDSLHHSIPGDVGAALHPHQVRLLGIARDALSEGREKLDSAQQKIEEALRVAEEELATQEAETEAASETAAASKKRSESLEAAAQDTEMEVAEMQKDLETTELKSKEVLQETQRQQALRQATCEASAQLSRLSAGAWASEEEWWEPFASLQQHLLDTGAESSLLTAATVSLRKRPSDRSAFDGIAVEGVNNFFQQQLGMIDKQLAGQSRLEMEAEATILGIQALLNVTQQRALQQRQASIEAQTAQETSETAAATGKSKLELRRVAVAQKQQEQVDGEARLASAKKALELLDAWITGIPDAGNEVQLPMDECESTMTEGQMDYNPLVTERKEITEFPASTGPDAPGLGTKDDVTILRNINSPLRVPTPMKGRN
mmetsp:Transcript_2824/g.4811  ORF Transcript_2824/g.4811 Transcript_2824/m.4811 type:complete len:525 (+) Transcript_2824:40-1614(+)